MNNLLVETKLHKKLDNYGDDFKRKVIEETQNQLNELSFGGIKNAANVVTDKLKQNTTEPINNLKDKMMGKLGKIKDSFETTISDIKTAYYNGNIEEIENEIIDILINSVDKINQKRIKSGQPPLNKKSVLMGLVNKANKRII